MTLNGTGTDAYVSFPLDPNPPVPGSGGWPGLPNTTDAGCADLRIGLGGPPVRNLSACAVGAEGTCRIELVRVESTASLTMFAIETLLSETDTQLRAVAYTTLGEAVPTAWISVDDQIHQLRLDWWTGEDGGVRFLIDGAVVGERRAIDIQNSTVEAIHTGALDVPFGADAAFAIDEFVVRRSFDSAGVEAVTDDGFETDLSAWEHVSEGFGTIETAASAALEGDRGLEIGIGSGWGSYIHDLEPAAVRRLGRKLPESTSTRSPWGLRRPPRFWRLSMKSPVGRPPSISACGTAAAACAFVRA